jgi:hypothetical protein
MFHDLIPLLADRFHLIAPDLPGAPSMVVSQKRSANARSAPQL